MIVRRLVPVLLLAFVVSGVFTLWLSKHAGRPVAAATLPVLRYAAAAKDLHAGDTIQESSIVLTDWPASRPVPGAFLRPADLVGRVLLLPLATGELVVEHTLAAVGAGAGLTAKIPSGMRAISLRTDEVIGVSGFLTPGSYVDVLVTYHPSTTPDFITATVLQDARVLAAGQKTEPDPEGKATTTDVVTLLASPQDAEKLTLASSLGKLHFILRNGVDRAESDKLVPQLVLSAETREVAPRPQRVIPRAAVYTVQTITGNKQREESFLGTAK
jgi:pilus assembly protein CpaB